MKTLGAKPWLNDCLCLSPFLPLSFSSLAPARHNTHMKALLWLKAFEIWQLQVTTRCHVLITLKKLNWQNKIIASFLLLITTVKQELNYIFTMLLGTLLKYFRHSKEQTRVQLVLLLYPSIMLCFPFPCVIFQSSLLGLAVTGTVGSTGFAVLCCQRTLGRREPAAYIAHIQRGFASD